MKKLIIIFLSIFSFINVYAISPAELLNDVNQLDSRVNENNGVNHKYPVGTILMTSNNKNPSSSIGGTWVRYGNGRKLVSVNASDDSYNRADLTGGSNSASLSVNTMPSHSHSFTPSGSVSSSFSGNTVWSDWAGSHSHTFPYVLQTNVAAGRGARLLDNSYNYVNNKAINSHKDSWFAGRVAVTTDKAGVYTNTVSEQFWVTASGSAGSSFTGSQVTTSSVGSGSSFDIKNPYQTVYMWQRTA